MSRLILLHGLLGSAQHWSQCRPGLEQHFAVESPELPGISAAPAAAHADLPGLADWLDGVVHRESSAYSIVASSWAGAIALQLASRGGAAKLQRLVLCAPVHPFWHPSRRQRWLLRPAVTRSVAAVGRHLPAAMCRRLLEPSFGDPARISRDTVFAYRTVLRLPHLGRGLAAYARDYRRDLRTLEPALGSIAAPTLLLWGERDHVVSPRSAAALQRALPRAELHLLPGLGHLPFCEDADAFNRAILPFLMS